MYYLSVFPDVHIWRDQDVVLFYDVSNNKQCILNLDSESRPIIDAFMDIRNLYCVQLQERQCHLPFVERIVADRIGVVTSCQAEERPTTIPPIYYLENRLNDGVEKNSGLILDLVREVTIHLEQGCNCSCTHCKSLFKQTNSCTCTNHSFSSVAIPQIASKVSGLKNLKKINLAITKVDSSVLDEIRILTLPGILSCYYIDWKNASREVVASLLEVNNSALIKILLNISEVSSVQLDEILSLQSTFCESIILVICISSESDQIRVEELMTMKPTPQNIEIKCFYTGKNAELIRKQYLLNNKELQELSADHNTIFGNRELDFALFGVFIIYPDGTIRLNENTEVIGVIEDDWTKILNKAINKPNPWLMTRSKTKPCSNCVYRDLCPPIRNLELYMGDKLACADYYKNVSEPDDAH